MIKKFFSTLALTFMLCGVATVTQAQVAKVKTDDEKVKVKDEEGNTMKVKNDDNGNVKIKGKTDGGGKIKSKTEPREGEAMAPGHHGQHMKGDKKVGDRKMKKEKSTM